MGIAENFDSTAYSREIMPEDLVVTESARAKIGELIEQADDDLTAVRVYVAGGGCSGMTYGMTFAESDTDRDSVLEQDNGFKLVVDPIALNYLRGAEIDFTDDGVNASFVFNNVFKAVGGSGGCAGCGATRA
ncbi:MAG: iron-sulfur cluster assembly accessory protein [Gammaproteobacteria bacterium]|nr:iron-sulfur cluster assembly accessory protein [Gammaproteobacteria bacterium]